MQDQSGNVVVRQDRDGDVAVLTLAHPPVNALSDAVRSGLAQGLAAALADPAVRAVVICGEGRGFSAGADIAEFGRSRQALRLGALCLVIENAAKPVIAAIHGMALGGGLELALAAHYRIANEAAVLGLPEVNLGLLPGAGGTQRLPRLIGARDALRLMLTGVPITATEALALGLVDRVVASGTTQAALTEAALAMAAEGLPPRPTGAEGGGLQDARAYLAAVNEARAAQAANRLPAPARIVDCVEAALLFPLPQGLQAEETAFADLVTTPEAAGLRHAFFTERRALQLPAAATALGIKPFATLGLWGLGEGVVEIAGQALTAGMRVVLASPDRPALVEALEQIAGWQDAAVAAGRMTEAARDADWVRLITSVSPEPLAGAELILRAPGVEVLPPSAGSAPVAVLGAAGQGDGLAITVASGPGGVSELALSATAAPQAVARLASLARRLNWRLVPVGPGGPVELGLRQALDGAMDHLKTEGFTARAVTEAQRVWASLKVAGMAGAAAAADARIIAVCLAALAAEGARMLQDGRARRPLEVDAIALLSGIVPRWVGGPMFQADQRGLLVLRQDLIALAERAPVFLPPVLIDRMIADGQTFASLNGLRV